MPDSTFQHLMDALLDESRPFPAHLLHHFSDLSPEEVTLLQETWPRLSLSRRRGLLEDLERISLTDLLTDFSALCRLALNDPDGVVRMVAIRTLMDYDTDQRLAPHLMTMLTDDPDVRVRAAAASALGQYVYGGEIEEIPADLAHAVEDRLLAVIHSTDAKEVRRRALEALGFSSRPEIPALIEEAYHRDDEEWLCSAIFAMGRSANQRRWRRQVRAMLDHDSPRVRMEAARAAGELVMPEARETLLALLDDPDQDVREAAVWALSEIGGPEVRAALESYRDLLTDEEDIEYLDDALDNLDFTEDVLPLLMEVDENGEMRVFDPFAEDEMDAFEDPDNDL